MSEPARPIAITGTTGRLGAALLSAVGPTAVAWQRPAYDLDRPDSAVELLERDRPSLVIHPAAMTNVDACAREPELAMRRNGAAVGTLARACAGRGTQLLLVSTNEVFDGDRDDQRGYVETDEPAPRNPYGASKLAGEVAARDAFADADGLWIVRTAWLYGPPGAAFPEKILKAADRLPPDEPLSVVDDEFGSPTLAADLAKAIISLVERTSGGLYHLVNTGQASRLDWARRVLRERRPDRAIRPISRSAFERASDPPPWGVLDTARADAAGVVMRDWQTALDAHLGVARQ